MTRNTKYELRITKRKTLSQFLGFTFRLLIISFVFQISYFVFAPPSVFAFGKNKVIAHNFRWKVRTTPHFLFHYTPEAEAIVPRVEEILEKSYERLTTDLDIEIKERTPFYLFVNHNRFEENNIADVGEGTGGVTEAFKNRFIVFHNGRQFWLEHVIPHEFAHVCEFEVLYGGFWRSARLLKSPLYPLWFMEGLAEYVTGDLDVVEEDVYLRDAATTDRLYGLPEIHGFNHVKPHEVTLAYKQGAAAVQFLAKEYGIEKPGALLKSLRERFEIGSALADITGQTYSDFNFRYLEHMKDYYAVQAAGLQEPETYGTRLTTPDLLPVFNTHPTLSPDGRSLAYVTDRRGSPEVALYDLHTGEHRFLAGRQWRRLEYLHQEGRALSFSPDGRWIAFAAEKEQRDYLFLYDVKRDRLRRIRLPFEQVRSPVFHPNGDRLAVVGMKEAWNDLYEVTPRGKILRKLTNSAADEDDPVYSPDGQTLVFSQEVTTPRWPGRDLMAMDLVSLTTGALTNLPGREYSPVFTPDGRSLIFVGEVEGAPNLCRLDISDGKSWALTRVIGANYTPNMSKDGRSLVFSSFRRGSQEIYRAEPSLWEVGSSTTVVQLAGQPSGESWAKLSKKGETPPEPEVAAPPPAFADSEVAVSQPYRFKASTDLFFPVLFYSSTDGLFVAAFWQASEYLGNHQLQTAIQYASMNDFLDYQIQYRYLRFRPQFFIGAGGENFYRDFSRTELRRESETFGGVAYPLDRFHRLEGVVGSLHRQDSFEKLPILNYEERENFVSGSWVRDTTTGRYLAVTAGSRFRLTYRESRPYFGGDRDYKSHSVEYHQFRPTGRESTLAVRAAGGVSTGPSPQLVRLGGIDRIRGYSRRTDANHAARYVFSNVEWRVPLKYLNWRTWFLFPDFSVKAIYGTLFVDTGYDWTSSDGLNRLRHDRIRSSVGGGIRLPIFILQSFPVTVSMDLAKRTDTDTWVWYLSVGPPF